MGGIKHLSCPHHILHGYDHHAAHSDDTGFLVEGDLSTPRSITGRVRL